MTLPSNGLTRIAGDFAPPVARARTIEGDAGHGPSAPKVVSADGRIIISRRGLITCSDPLFEREFWRVPTGDRWAGVRIVGPDVLLTLPGTPMLVDVASGRVVAEYRNPDITVAASTGWLFSYDTTTKQSTLASAGGEILFRGSLPAGVVFDDAVVCFSHDVGSAVTCVPLNAPDRRWTWKVPPAGDELPRVAGGFAGIALVDGRILVTTSDSSIVELDPHTGHERRTLKVPHGGGFITTHSDIFFWNGGRLTVVDHGAWEVVSSEEIADVVPLYRGQSISANAFAMSTRAIVWTTMHGSLMAVALGEDRPRAVWEVADPGAIMPIAVPPVLCGPYLYHTVLTEPLRGDVHRGG